MMDSFIRVMDSVKAEEAVKEKTKAYVTAALNQAPSSRPPVRSAAPQGRARKRAVTAVLAAAVCLLLVVGGYAGYMTPRSFVSVDINPSVELGVNVFGTVVSTESFNEDGAFLLEAGQYRYLSLENAVSALVCEAAAEGYLAEDGSTVIAVTAETNDLDKAEKLSDAGETGVNAGLSTAGYTAVCYAASSDPDLRSAAAELGLSPGKYALIRLLQTLDPSISVEEYRNAKMTEIILKAQELLALAGEDQSEISDESAEEILSAAGQVQAARGSAQAEQNSNTEQNQGESSAIQDQNQHQEQNQNPSETEQAQESGTQGAGPDQEQQGQTDQAEQGESGQDMGHGGDMGQSSSSSSAGSGHGT